MRYDASSGLLDYGARLYDPALARWISIDPLAEKYVSISPYVYCINDPINLIDPDGREIYLKTYDDEGRVHYVSYHPGMIYDGTDPLIQGDVLLLNNMFCSGGRVMIYDLITSSRKYYITDEKYSDKDGGATIFNGDEGATIMLGAALEAMGSQSLGALAHELMHAAQYEYGQGGRCIFNEVEAYVFGYMISMNSGNLSGEGFGSSADVGQENRIGLVYEKAFFDLVSTGFTKELMITLVKNFKLGSMSNQTGLYNGDKIMVKNNMDSILEMYYPSI